jgi:hypothetical protein
VAVRSLGPVKLLAALTAPASAPATAAMRAIS